MMNREQFKECRNTYLDKALQHNVQEGVAKSLSLELALKESWIVDGHEAETRGNVDEARSMYKGADERTTFVLGMLETLRTLKMIDEAADRAMVDLAYSKHW